MRLIERLTKAKQTLTPFQTEYAVVYEDVGMETCFIMHPDPNAMAALMAGGIFPPVWVHWELAKDEAKPDFKKHTRGYLLHDTPREPAKTEEEAVLYLVMKDVPKHIWSNWNSGNKPKMAICKRDQLPTDKTFRNAWRLAA